MKRDSSPPLAIRVSGPNGAPGLVETSNSTRSVPRGSGLGRSDGGTEPGGIQLQRRKLGGHRGVERFAPPNAAGCSALRPPAHNWSRAACQFAHRAGRSARRSARSAPAGSRICSPSAASASASTRCLRASAADIEQPRFDRFEPRRVERQGVGRAGDPVLRLAGLDQRPVERRQRLGQQGVISRPALDPPRRQPQLGERAVGPAKQLVESRSALRPPWRRPASPPAPRPAGSPRQACGASASISADAWASQSRSRVGRRRLSARLGQLALDPGDFGPGRSRPDRIDPAERIEQLRDGPLRVEQAAIVMLAVDFDD